MFSGRIIEMRELRASLRPEKEVEIVHSLLSDVRVSLQDALTPESPFVRLVELFEKLVRSGQEYKRTLEERERALRAEETKEGEEGRTVSNDG